MSAELENQLEQEKLLVEERKVKALEKIAMSLDALTVWFEEIDKEDWDNRLQFYLNEFHKSIVPENKDTDE